MYTISTPKEGQLWENKNNSTIFWFNSISTMFEKIHLCTYNFVQKIHLILFKYWYDNLQKSFTNSRKYDK